ncbi:MAG TPA: PQQ-binding-like beta-propeller repeat protein, partial [Actinomycetota bacterium]
SSRPSIRSLATAPDAFADGPAVVVGNTAWILGGRNGSALSQVLEATVVQIPEPGASQTAASAAERPFAGLLVVADRGNNRLLVMNEHKQIVWTYPSPGLPRPPFRFYFPDDAFWVHGGRAILINEEDNDVLAEIAYPSGRTIWTYGHPGAPGKGPGYLHQPDDVYPYPGGGVVVADAQNCVITFFSAAGHKTRSIGNGSCTHHLPTSVGYPNGDTPLPNGNLLLSELNGAFVDEVTPDGRPVWSLHVREVRVPSDPQELPDHTFLVVSYDRPGRVVRFTSSGKVLWSYGPSSGKGMLDHPSLAAPLPNGLVAVTDDYGDRVVLIDPATNRIVWHYGHWRKPGTSSGYLATPDGLDLLLPDGSTPLHVDFASATVRNGRP